MKKAHAAIISVVAFMIGAAALPGEDFYVTRLRSGEAALRAQRPIEAIEQLRIANFGLLDRPVLLEEGIVHLALAYAQAERIADVDASLTRFVEVESRFGVYPKVALEADVKTRFEDLVRRRVRPEVVAQLPGLAGLVPPPPRKAAEKKK